MEAWLLRKHSTLNELETNASPGALPRLQQYSMHYSFITNCAKVYCSWSWQLRCLLSYSH